MKKIVCIICVLISFCIFSACQQEIGQKNDTQSSQELSAASKTVVSDGSSALQDSSSKNESKADEIWTSPDLDEFGELDDKTLERISKLKKNMTEEQVHEIFGKPDKIPETGIYWEYFYINGNEHRWIKVGYFSDGIAVQLGDSNIHKSVTIL